MPTISDWNVVVTVYDRAFRRACRMLSEIAPVTRTDYYNVVVMKVEDVRVFLERLAILSRDHPEILNSVARTAPAMRSFDFQSKEEFEQKARETVLSWAAALAGNTFFVRLHRRGCKSSLPSQDEERLLDKAILEALAAEGTPGRVGFENPDAVIDIETIDKRAGLSLWTRDDLRRHPLLRLR